LVQFALVSLRWGLTNCLPGLGLNVDPPHFSLPSNQDYKHEEGSIFQVGRKQSLSVERGKESLRL
jgi:hypothetical protein